MRSGSLRLCTGGGTVRNPIHNESALQRCRRVRASAQIQIVLPRPGTYQTRNIYLPIPLRSDEARPAPASRPASRAGNQAPDTSAPAPEAAAPEVEGQGGEGEGRERDDGFEDAAAVLEHWTRRGGEAGEGDAAGDERWRLKLGEAGMVGRGEGVGGCKRNCR